MSKTEEILERCNKPGAKTGPTSAELHTILAEQGEAARERGSEPVHVLEKTV